MRKVISLPGRTLVGLAYDLLEYALTMPSAAAWAFLTYRAASSSLLFEGAARSDSASVLPTSEFFATAPGKQEQRRNNQQVPAALVEIGLGWLYVNRRRTPSYSSSRYYNQGVPRGYQGYYQGRGAYVENRGYGQSQRGVGETISDVASKAQERVGDITGKAQETVGNIVNQAQETVGNIVNQAQETAANIGYQAQRAENRFQYQLRENPLAIGVLALALGTAIGLAVPETQAEHEFMGEAHDKLVDKAQDIARDTMEKVQRVAGDVMDEAQTAVQERMQGDGGASSSSQGREQASGSSSNQKPM